MEFDLVTVIGIFIIGLVIGCWLRGRYTPRVSSDDSWRLWQTAWNAGRMAGPPRFIGEDENEAEPADVAGS